MENKRISTLLKLIANPERMSILLLLMEGNRNISELAAATDLPAPVVSNHLAKLRTEGVVELTRYHRVIEYRLVSDAAATVLRTVINLQTDKRESA